MKRSKLSGNDYGVLNGSAWNDERSGRSLTLAANHISMEQLDGENNLLFGNGGDTTVYYSRIFPRALVTCKGDFEQHLVYFSCTTQTLTTT